MDTNDDAKWNSWINKLFESSLLYIYLLQFLVPRPHSFVCDSSSVVVLDSFNISPLQGGREGDAVGGEVCSGLGNVNGKLMAIIYWDSHDHFQLRNSSTRCNSLLSCSSFLLTILTFLKYVVVVVLQLSSESRSKTCNETKELRIRIKDNCYGN